MRFQIFYIVKWNLYKLKPTRYFSLSPIKTAGTGFWVNSTWQLGSSWTAGFIFQFILHLETGAVKDVWECLHENSGISFDPETDKRTLSVSAQIESRGIYNKSIQFPFVEDAASETDHDASASGENRNRD